MESRENLQTTKNEDSFFELVRFAVICILIVVPFRLFIAQPYVVEGSSMEPTLKDGDYLIVDQLSYNFNDPQRGDVMVFKYPSNPKRILIKRIIGLPLETVTLRQGKVFIKKESTEFELKEDYISFTKEDNFEFTLKEKQYFVMGDNRANSSDSRSWGPLLKENLIGRPVLRLLPLNSIDVWPGRNVKYNEEK